MRTRIARGAVPVAGGLPVEGDASAVEPVAPAAASGATGREPADSALPRWFVTGLVFAITWCATAGAFGVTLLIFGGYHPLTVAGVGLAAAALAAFAAARGLGPPSGATVHHGAALVAVGLAVAFLVFAGALHSEHILEDRDPALYVNNGRSIARTHEYKPHLELGAFSVVRGRSVAQYKPNFFPMLPVLLALGWSAGGAGGLFLVGPVLGALGALACYALGSRLLGPRRGLLVPAFLVLEPLQLWFARDAYSELVVQVVVVGGFWLYLEARRNRRPALAAVAGLLVASSYLARIDALAVLVGTFVLAALEWVWCDRDAEPVRARRTVLAFVVAVVAGTALTQRMSYALARGYIHALGVQRHQLVLAVEAAFAFLVIVVIVHRLRPGIGSRIAQNRTLFVSALGAGGALALWAYVWRPIAAGELPVAVPGQPDAHAVVVASKQWHYAHSLRWFSAYFGLATVVVAVVGYAVLAARSRRGNHAAATVLFVALPVTLMYLARPAISPDQPWAMRRYLPIVIPGMVLALAAAADAGWRAARAVRGRAAGAVAIAGVVGAGALVVVPTAASAVPFATARMQHGAQAAIDHTCRTIGDDGAVLVFGARYLDIELPQPLRSFCGVPVARATDVDLADLARRWQALGRTFYVATAVPDAVHRRVPGAVVAAHEVVSDDDDPEKVLDRAPGRSRPTRVDIWIMRIPVEPA